jgi:uncharacterized protein (TIGR02996 family)
MTRKRTLTSDEAFLRAIRESPGDDGPRLVYADWLDENGQPERAEFIRIQHRLAQMDEDDPERPLLKDREWELLAVHGKAWRAQMPKWIRAEQHEFRRGFVSWINLTPRAYTRKASALYRTTPIAGLQLRNMYYQTAEVAACPLLARLRSLKIHYAGLTGDDVAVLIASPHLTNLQELSLPSNRISVEGARALAHWPRLAQLRSLDLSNNGLPPEALRELLASRYLTNLECLELGGNPVGEAIQDLAREPRLATLRHLGLPRCGADAETMRVLGASETLTALTSLALSGLSVDAYRTAAVSALFSRLTNLSLVQAPPGADVAAALASAPDLTCLRRLDMSQCHLGDDGMQALAKARFGGLRFLWLAQGKITPTGIAALANAPALASVTHLCLNWNNTLGPNGARALALSPYWTNLTALYLCHCKFGDEGAKHLASSPAMANLTTLLLNQRSVGLEGVRALAASPHLRSLRYLELAHNNLPNEAAEALAASPHLGRLRKLVLCGNYSISDAGRKALHDSPNLPNLIAVNMRSPIVDEVVPRLARS